MTSPKTLEAATITGAYTDFQPQVFVLSGINKESRPSTACASCPSGIWFDRNGWQCYCNIMKFLSWKGESKTILSCDGRENSIAKWNEEQAKIAIEKRAR